MKKNAIDPKAKFEIDGKHYSAKDLWGVADDIMALVTTAQDMIDMPGDAAPGAVDYSMKVLLEKSMDKMCVIYEFLADFSKDDVEVADV